MLELFFIRFCVWGIIRVLILVRICMSGIFRELGENVEWSSYGGDYKVRV